MKRPCWILAGAALLLAVSVPALAQQAASIRGTILDPQGKPVAGATVTAVQVETGFVRTAPTGAAGTYALPELPIGSYVVTVEAEGFRTLVVQSVALNVADVREIDSRLELGPVGEAITVSAAALTPKTVGGEVAGLITGEQVRELPLNGRNFAQLTQLMPGVVTEDAFNTKDKGLLSLATISVAGGRASANLWTVDGASNNDVGSNLSILVYPSLEAIEEFKIHRSSYGAEFGGAGGAQVNLVTRGGTNDLRGSVFYFARRGSWNESNYILKRADVEPDDLTRDDYGFTLGGPVRQDKLHFFVSTEWNDEVRGNAVSGAVPSAAEKRGDFSQSDTACRPIPVDPLTGQPFPDDVIPADRLGEAGQALLQLYPDANAAGCLNWVGALSVPLEWNQINARVDWSLTDRARLMIRYTEDDWRNPGPTAGGANGLWGDDPFPSADSAWEQPSESLVAKLSNVLAASALNTVTYSLSGNEIGIAQVGDTALQERIRATNPPTFPAELKLAAPGTAHPFFWGAGGLSMLWQQSPWFNDLDMKGFKDDYEQVFGKHHLKAGVLYAEAHKLEPALASASMEMPNYWASTGLGGWGPTSGNLIADFLLDGMTFGFSEVSHSQLADLEWRDLELYLADSWKLRHNLTLDVGIRYSRFFWPENIDGSAYLSFNPDRFDPSLGASACNGLMQVPGTDPCGAAGFPGASAGPNAALIHSDDNFAPRLGLAWDVYGTGKSVLRAGFGQFYQREQVGSHLTLLGNPPAVRSTAGIRSLDGEILVQDFVGYGRPTAGFDVDARTPFMVQYNLTWEQQLGRSSTIEIGYVGSKGRNLLRFWDINQVPLSQDMDGNGVDDRLDFVRCGASDAGCRARYRPFGAFGDAAITYWGFDGRSDYDSLQAQLIARFGRGSQLQASYTLADFTANTDVVGPGGQGVTDLYRPDSDEGTANLRRRHVLNSSLIYNLPAFEGRGGAREWLLGHWTVSGLLIYATGTPLTVFSGNPGGELDGTHPAAIGAGQKRPLATGAPCRGTGALGVLDPAAYTLTGYELGNSAQQMPPNTCDGPDFLQVDLSLYKRLPLEKRFDVQLRLEVFNLFNTVNLIGSSVDLGFNPPVTLDAPRGQATVVTGTGPPAATFGQARQARDAREIQLGIKLTF